MLDSQDDQINLTHTKKLGILQFQFYCKSQPQLCHLVFKIENLLKQSPQFYYHSILMINKGRSIDSIQRRLNKQLQNLSNGKSFYLIVQKAIYAREKCLQKIRTGLMQAQKVFKIFKKHYVNVENYQHISYIQYVQKEGYSTVQVQQTVQNSIKLIKQIFVDMSRLRDMTIYIVEMIHQWKVKLQEWLDKCRQWEEVNFTYHNLNVYEKILTDTQFIWQSTINEHIYISSTNDPFIIRNILAINERQQKTILQKYFLQLLYPKSQIVIQKGIKCYDMLTYKYVPKVNMLKREEEELIESYLQLRKKQLEEDNVGEIDNRQVDWEIDRNMQKQYKKLYPKGWTYGMRLKKPSQQKINQLIQRHQHKVTFIKPLVDTYKAINNNNTVVTQRNKRVIDNLQHAKLGFTTQINRFGLKSSMLNMKNEEQINSRVKSKKWDNVVKKTMREKQFTNNRQSNKVQKNQLLTPITHQQSLRLIRSRTFNNSNSSPQRMYKSLSRQSPVIFQHPQEYKQYQTTKNNISKQTRRKQIKSVCQNKNVKQKLQTNENRLSEVRQLIRMYKSTPKIQRNFKEKKIKRSTIFNQTKNLHMTNKISQRRSISILKNVRQKSSNKMNKSKSFQKRQNGSFVKQSLPSISQKVVESSKVNKNLDNNKGITIPTDKILLRPKSIPYDIIPTYMLHLFNRLNPTSKKFTLFDLQSLTTKLKNPLNQCIMFQISSSNKGNIGHVILSQSFSKVDKKLMYTIEFINITVFELFISTIIKVTQELLMTTPCDQVRMRVYEDRMDAVSVHFVELIESTLNVHVPRYGKFFVTQTKTVNYKDIEMTQKLLTFQKITTNNSKLQHQKLSKQLMSNYYRSLRFECKCIILGSNFRMRSKTGVKNIVNNYNQQSLGYLYLSIFAQILIKRHLRQIKALLAENRSDVQHNDNDDGKEKEEQTYNNDISFFQTNRLTKNYDYNLEFIKTSVFILRQYLQQLSPTINDKNNNKNSKQHQQHLKQHLTTSTHKDNLVSLLSPSSPHINLIKFTHMPQLLNYLQYKKYQQHFNFSFLEQSRFFLNHQLYLSQLQIQFSLQFMCQQSVNFLILNNYLQKMVKVLSVSDKEQQQQQKDNSLSIMMKCIILPTTNKDIQLVFIDGNQYLSQSHIDLFSYLYHYQQKYFTHLVQKDNIKQIIIPKLHLHKQHHTKNNNIKMFNGLFKLFPERQFYSATYFKTYNLWQSYFPSAVMYQPQNNAIVFQYPLIVGFMCKRTQQILTAFLLKDS